MPVSMAGDYGDSLYMVVDGEVEVYRRVLEKDATQDARYEKSPPPSKLASLLAAVAIHCPGWRVESVARSLMLADVCCVSLTSIPSAQQQHLGHATRQAR